MTQEAGELLKKALALPVSERADLAGSLIESLDDTQANPLQRPGTRKSRAAWSTSTPARSSRFRSKRLVAACCPLSNERSLILLSSGCHRRSPLGCALVP